MGAGGGRPSVTELVGNVFTELAAVLAARNMCSSQTLQFHVVMNSNMLQRDWLELCLPTLVVISISRLC